MPRKSLKVDLKCAHCKKDYQLPPSKAKNSKYCSRSCKDKENIVYKEHVKCQGCSKVIRAVRGKKFCSKECYNNVVKISRVELKCQTCGKKYEKPVNRVTKYCSKKCQGFLFTSFRFVRPFFALKFGISHPPTTLLEKSQR